MSTTAGTPDALPLLEVDVAVVGSGAAGLAAALTAASRGLRVAVFEKGSRLGGTTAWCSGWMWIPGSKVEPVSPDDPASARRYLEAELGPKVFAAQQDKIDAFLTEGPAMVEFFSKHFRDTLVFERDDRTPDFHTHPDQRMRGRMVRVKAFDACELGGELERLREPLPEFSVMGLAIEAGADLDAFVTSTGPLKALRTGRLGQWAAAVGLVLKRLFENWADQLLHGRGMRLVNGHALVARLVAAAARLEQGAGGAPGAAGFKRLGLFTDHAVVSLRRGAARVDGLLVRTPQGDREVQVRERVILACGGFPHDMARIHALFPQVLTYTGHHSAAPPENTGDGLRLAEAVGGQVGPTCDAPAALVPVSVRRRADDSQAVYPHFIDRSKPGTLAVLRNGRRFCNEAAAYHDIVRSWLANSPPGEPLQAWLVCDYLFLLRFGLGMVKPLSVLPVCSLASGYLKFGWTLEGLAHRCGINAVALREEVMRHNADAARERDANFARGDSAYDRSQGDPLARGNPCLGPLRGPPYFAVRLHAGSLGTLAGLQTDAQARVLEASGKPIAGLYACGNDMAAVMGGKYPTNGVTLASAMTFGHIAAR